MQQGQRIGYVRVSSFYQNPDRQLEKIETHRTFTDRASGKDVERPELQALLEYAREGDTVVVHSMDRLARNLDDLLLSAMGAFAEFERTLIKERQREGIALAKQRGAYRGRKKALTQEQVTLLQKRAADGEPKTRLAREFGISRETLYQYLKSSG